jgi:hypothetical protein
LLGVLKSNAAKNEGEQDAMPIAIEPMDEELLPFSSGGHAPDQIIEIQSELDEGAIADGETEPFNWMDLGDVRENFSILLNADEFVLETPEATLALTYPLNMAATRVIRPENGKAFTRGELVKLIEETYQELYRLETDSQSLPTPPVHERGSFINRPESDGIFGVWGHDLGDLGVSEIAVYRIAGRVWLDLDMVS